MIELVDRILRLGLLAQVPGLDAQQIGFQPPDVDWRARVGGVPGVSLNIHLAAIAEDRPLRTNAVHREIDAGVVRLLRPPERIRLHYVLSAWSQAKDSHQVAATEAEHALLGRVLGGLFRLAPLNASRSLSDGEIQALPEALREELPTRIAPPDAFPRLGEFWSTMGRPQAWKPVIDLFVTAPVVYATEDGGGVVETILAGIAGETDPGAASLAGAGVLVVGGVVRSAAFGPTGGAAVELRGIGGGPADGRRDATITAADGSFTFAGLAPGTYELAFSHSGHPTPAPVPVTVPLPDGQIDLVFVP